MSDKIRKVPLRFNWEGFFGATSLHLRFLIGIHTGSSGAHCTSSEACCTSSEVRCVSSESKGVARTSSGGTEERKKGKRWRHTKKSHIEPPIMNNKCHIPWEECEILLERGVTGVVTLERDADTVLFLGELTSTSPTDLRLRAGLLTATDKWTIFKHTFDKLMK